MKLIILYFLCFLKIISSEGYICKNKYEENILKKYRKEKLVLGLSNKDLKNKEYNGESLNLFIEDLFKNYLHLNVQVVKKDWDITKKMYKENEIDILGYFTSTEKRKRDFVFSDPIYSQELYIGSNKDELLTYDDLEGKDIYVLKNSIHSSFLENYLKNKNIKANLKDLKDLKDIKNSYIVGINDDVINYKYKNKIGNLPGVSISLNKKYEDLIPIINTALKGKYQRRINSFLEERKIKNYKDIFLNSLTKEEKVYLEKLQPVNIMLENDIEISHYSKNYKKYIGSLVLTLEELSKRTGIEFNIVENNDLSWTEIYQKLKTNEVNILPLAKTNERLKLFNFTKKIDYLNFYKINSYEDINDKIGTLDDSIEKKIIEDHYLDNNIQIYESRALLKDALRRKDIKSALLLSYNDIDMVKYKIENIEKIPIYLALSKDNEMLKNILNKGIATLTDKKSIREKAELIRNYDKYLDNKDKEFKYVIAKFWIVIFLCILIYLTYKLFYQVQVVNKLKSDHLTGLPSRYEFNKFKMENSAKLGFALLIDINNFKEVNDRYGHDTGDGVIIKISQIIKKIFPAKSSFRISGDEFYIFIFDTNIDKYLERLRNELEKCKIVKKYSLSLSVGYYYKKKEEESLEDCFKYADMAMYEAKNQQGIFFLEAKEELIRKKERNRAIKFLLREANLQEIYAVYQPKFDIKSKEIIGAEALARWTTKEMGFISPGEFIPLAEEIKSVHLIDYKIAEEAVKTIKKWKKLKLVNENFKLSFNVSMATFEREDIVDVLTSILQKYSVPGEWIEIEVTESILSSNLNKTLKKLNTIKGLKIQISIDDFTAGHSTASLLPYLPVSVVKFDKSILDIVTKEDRYNHSIYKNLISLVKDLNLDIVAEGIETEYQLEFLKENKVDMGQGFLFSKPISQKEFEDLL